MYKPDTVPILFTETVSSDGDWFLKVVEVEMSLEPFFWQSTLLFSGMHLAQRKRGIHGDWKNTSLLWNAWSQRRLQLVLDKIQGEDRTSVLGNKEGWAQTDQEYSLGCFHSEILCFFFFQGSKAWRNSQWPGKARWGTGKSGCESLSLGWVSRGPPSHSIAQDLSLSCSGLLFEGSLADGGGSW